MSKDEAIKNVTDKTNDVIEFKNDAINCSEIPNGSIISRQDVIELVKKSYYDLSDGEEDMWAMVHDVEQLPSAEPKTGKWLEVEVFPEVYDIEGVKTWGSEMQCDQCGFRFTAIEGHITQYNYCPYCGARMLGEDGEEE